jgi:hypothetical protein
MGKILMCFILICLIISERKTLSVAHSGRLQQLHGKGPVRPRTDCISLIFFLMNGHPSCLANGQHDVRMVGQPAILIIGKPAVLKDCWRAVLGDWSTVLRRSYPVVLIGGETSMTPSPRTNSMGMLRFVYFLFNLYNCIFRL